MAMLASSLQTVSRSKICRKEPISALLHSSSVLSKQVFKRKAISKQGSSHRRLVDDLRPSSRSGRLEVAPKDLTDDIRDREPQRQQFERDGILHEGRSMGDRAGSRTTAFRRRPGGRDEQDRRERPSRWSGEESMRRYEPESNHSDQRRYPDSSQRREDSRTQYSQRGQTPYERQSESIYRGRERSSFGDRSPREQERKPYERRSESNYSGRPSKEQEVHGRRSESGHDVRERSTYGDHSSRQQEPYGGRLESNYGRERSSYGGRTSREPERYGGSDRQSVSYQYGDHDHGYDNRRPDTRSSEWTPETVPTHTSVYKDGPQRDQAFPLPSPEELLNEETEFFRPPSEVSVSDTEKLRTRLPKTFTSPPLLPGLLNCIHDMLGPDAKPTPIQSLSMKWLLPLEAWEGTWESGGPKPAEALKMEKGEDGTEQKVLEVIEPEGTETEKASPQWKEFLLAAETGSGKSIAYLLPMLQHLKLTESASLAAPPTPRNGPPRPLNPRALVLAPTHELSRQLAGFAKSLLHDVKLRVQCASRANVLSARENEASSAREMSKQFDAMVGGDGTGEFNVKKEKYPVDVVVGTPMKLMEMIRGRGWDRMDKGEMAAQENVEEDEEKKRLRRGRDKMPMFGKWRSKPEMGLEKVEWVVVDEADVLFDPDFRESTLTLLSDISAARGKPVPLTVKPSPTNPMQRIATPASSPVNYPFNLLLTSATIPSALHTYLDSHHPSLVRLSSPRLHRLPKSLRTEYAPWTGGNKFADIERRIRQVWADDARAASTGLIEKEEGLSKIIIFCNRSNKVTELGEYLQEKLIKNVSLTSTSEHRGRGSNRHLDGFLKRIGRSGESDAAREAPAPPKNPYALGDPAAHPHVLITTSLLSRGLDFAPSIKHVFIVDEPRNMVDFIHRAGRSGRAGKKGLVVVFGKLKGRGSDRSREVRKRVGVLTA